MNLPFTLEGKQDKVLLNDEYWLVLDGIDHNGVAHPDYLGMIYILYKNDRYWVCRWVSEEMYSDSKFFWKHIRRVVASEICQLRKELSTQL